MIKRTAKSSPPGSARLFEESHVTLPAAVHVANIDGASRGNPGPAAYAMVLRGADGAKVCEIGKLIGRETNNVAEYYGLVAALDYAASHGIRALRIRSDSELLVRQMQGRYKVKNASLKPLHERARKLARALDYFVIEHVPREANGEADALANFALDRGGSESHSSAAPVSEARGSAKTINKASATQRVRAAYRGGVFVPAETVEVPEGATVELEIRISKIP